ncbi:cell division control protein 45 homolog [Gordionus sp. m RMFG-2023]|uniref:cell division control protein 45 homolog n=1 Tax=Gordionus sp. m RMFG-2023 TaxID=3053472 RepID=UPI0031FC64C4
MYLDDNESNNRGYFSHRPIDVYNIYNVEQVIVVVDEEEEQSFPDYADIFPSNENESDVSNSSDDERKHENINKLVKTLKRQKKKIRIEEIRQKVLSEYTQYSYWANPTSLIMYNISWMLSKETNSLLWCAILALTNHYLNNNIQLEKYILELSKLKNHVHRLNHKTDPQNNEKVFIKVISELNLYMYRHWTLFDSLFYSKNIACHFKVWTTAGRKRLNEFLADMGIPLSQSKQKFMCMDFQYRKNAKMWIEEFAEKYRIEDINFPSFSISFGYNKSFGATDYTLALNSILENSNPVNSNRPHLPFQHTCDSMQTQANNTDALAITNEENNLSYSEENLDFFSTLDCLSINKDNFSLLCKGIELAKSQAKLIFDEALSVLDTHQMLTVGPFLYASLPEHSSKTARFMNPNILRRLANFLLYAYHAKNNSKKKTKNLPLAICVPHKAHENFPESCTIIGLPPISIIETSSKNFLGKAFEQAAGNTNSTFNLTNFDPTIIMIKSKDKSKFFDALISMLD